MADQKSQALTPAPQADLQPAPRADPPAWAVGPPGPNGAAIDPPPCSPEDEGKGDALTPPLLPPTPAPTP